MPISTINSPYAILNFPCSAVNARVVAGAAVLSLLRFFALVAVLIPVISVAESVSSIRSIDLEGECWDSTEDVCLDIFEFTNQPLTNSKYAYFRFGEALWRTDGVNTKKLDFSNARLRKSARVVALNESVVYFQLNESDDSGPVTLWRANIGREHKAVRVLRLTPPGVRDRVRLSMPGTLDGEFVFEVYRYIHNDPRPRSTLLSSVLVTKDQGRRLPNRPVFSTEYTDWRQYPSLSLVNNRLFVIENRHKLWMFESGMSAPQLLTVREDPFWQSYGSWNYDRGGYGPIYGSNLHAYFRTPKLTSGGLRKTCELWRNDGMAQGYVSVDFQGVETNGDHPCPRIVAQVDDQIFYYRGPSFSPMELWTAKDNGASKRQLLTGLATRHDNHKRRSRFDAENSKLWMIVRKINQANSVHPNTVVSINQDGTDLKEHFETKRNLAFGPFTSSGPTFVAQNRNSLRTSYYSINTATGESQKFHGDKGRQPIMTVLNDKLIYFATLPRRSVGLYSYDPERGRRLLIHRFPRIR